MPTGTAFSDQLRRLRRQARTTVLPRLDAVASRAIGEIAINLALRRGLSVSVCIARPGQTLFFCALDGSGALDETRLQARMRTALAFGQSSMEVGLRLRQCGRSLPDFGFDNETLSIEGGAIPLFVREQGLEGAAAIAGLTSEADHELIVEAVCWHVGVEYNRSFAGTPFQSARAQARLRNDGTRIQGARRQE